MARGSRFRFSGIGSRFRKCVFVAAAAFPLAFSPSVIPVSVQAADFKLMTFNIRNGGDKADWNARKAQVFALVKNNAPDAAGMQEVFKYQLDELLAALPGYAAVGVGRDDGKTAGEYSPIFYRTSVFQVDTSGTFWLSATPEVPGSKVPGAGNTRIDTWARLRHIATGKSFYFHSSHWDHVAEDARLLSAKLIAQRIVDRKFKQDPVVFVCDCNAVATEAPMKYLTGQGGSPLAFQSAYDKLHHGVAASATFNDFKGDTLGQPIDHIMSFDSIPALDARILRDHIGSQYPSDHYPLLATLRFPALTSGLARPGEGARGGWNGNGGAGGKGWNGGSGVDADAAGRLHPAPESASAQKTGTLRWNTRLPARTSTR
jgi:endonuclease/exonuclease/phosphatase family metal-dependent hydrolase